MLKRWAMSSNENVIAKKSMKTLWLAPIYTETENKHLWSTLNELHKAEYGSEESIPMGFLKCMDSLIKKE